LKQGAKSSGSRPSGLEWSLGGQTGRAGGDRRLRLLLGWPPPAGHYSKLFSPLWTDFLPLGQKCHFRPFSAGFNRCRLDRLGREVTRVLGRNIQVGVYKSPTVTTSMRVVFPPITSVTNRCSFNSFPCPLRNIFCFRQISPLFRARRG
jgi:hypothetical protein